MPELGSKISLISKADIRYEGRLFTVDPQECTIALASGKLTNLYQIIPIYCLLCNLLFSSISTCNTKTAVVSGWAHKILLAFT